MSAPWTRGLKTSQELETKIIRTWKKYGARWVEGHGVLAGFTNTVTKLVPPKTVIIFLAEPGKCMYISAGRKMAALYFQSDQTLENFFKGEAGRAGIHHGNILSRTFFEGQPYPNMSVLFRNKNFPGFGYVRKLPLRRDIAENNLNLRFEKPPERGDIYNAIKKGNNLTLESIMNILGPGVYIVSACLPPPDYKANRLPMNSPKGRTGPSTVGLRRLRHVFSAPRASVRAPKPGTLKKTHTPKSRFFWLRPPGPRVTVSQVLRSIAKNPRTSKYNLINKLPANTNIERIAQAKRIFLRKRETAKFVEGLSTRSRILWAATPVTMRPLFIHGHLKTKTP